MHGVRNQYDPYLEFGYISTAAKIEAQKVAERTRKKLLEAASALAAEAGEDGYVVRLRSREGQQKGSEEQQKGSEEQERGSEGQMRQTNLSQMVRGVYGS